MDDAVMLLLVRHLFPEWVIMRDGAGGWWGLGRTLISAADLDGLLEALAVAAPDAARCAVSLLAEGR